MASPRSDLISLYVAPMSDKLTDPSANGSGYLPVPAFNVAGWPSGKPPKAVNYADGSNWPGNPTEGVEDLDISFETDAYGLLTSGADAASVAVDARDVLLAHSFGPATNMTRAAVGGAEAIGQTIITMASGTSRVAGDPVCFYENALARAQFARVQSVATNDWTISPALEYALTTAGFSQALRVYREVLGGGNELAFVLARGPVGALELRVALLCRLTKLIIKLLPDERTVCQWGFRASRQVIGGSKGSLPSPLLAPASTPTTGALSPVFINGVSAGHVSEVTIDFQPKALRIPSVWGDTAGRAADEAGRFEPKATINPVHAESFYAAVRAAGPGAQVQFQLGAGNGDGDPINSECIYFDNMGAVDAEPEAAEEGLLRTKVEYTTRHPGLATGARFLQWVRV